MSKINTTGWKDFKIKDLAILSNGNKLDKNKMTFNNPEINFISRTANNNGVSALVDRIDNIEPYPSGSISLAFGGSVGSCFVQKQPFYTGQNVGVITLPDHVSYEAKIFFITVLEKKCKTMFSAFENEINKHFKTDLSVILPAKKDEPDWQYMEEYIKSLKFESENKIKELVKISKESHYIPTGTWAEFNLTDLFDIKGSKTTKKNDLNLEVGGKYPYVTTSGTDNGIYGYSNLFTEEGNVITIDSAVLGTAFYQKQNFTASDHVEKLIPKGFEMNENIGLFISTILNSTGKLYGYAYNEKRSQTALKKEIIKLPVKGDGTPDWQYMDEYIERVKRSVANKITILNQCNKSEAN